jgi:hypothetical protein
MEPMMVGGDAFMPAIGAEPRITSASMGKAGPVIDNIRDLDR